MNKIKNNLEEEIVALLSNCIYQKVDTNNLQNHPIRVVEAAKSIIGLNLESPPMKLVNYIRENYSDNLNKIGSLKSDIKSKTVSIYQLEEAINQDNFDKAVKILDCLLVLSDGRHILEYLLELSLKKTGKSLLVIWSTYKTLNFIDYSSIDNVRGALLIAVEVLINDNFHSSNNNQDCKIESIDYIFNNFDLDDYQLQIVGSMYEIFNEQFIRESFIKSSLKDFLNSFAYDLTIIKTIKDEINLSFTNRKYLLDLLENIKINDKNILNINALRSYMKNSSAINESKLTNYISLIKES